jgi:hypothetical protein
LLLGKSCKAPTARYEASRIERQYQATEPENRLVAAELEKRWMLPS